MKIVRFDGGRIGLVIDGTVRDVTDAAGVEPREWPPVGPVRLIAEFDSRRGALEAAAVTAPPIPLDNVELEPMIPWPNKLLAYPVNYRDHAAEMATAGLASVQGFFLKANSSLCGAGATIEIPDLPGREVHHECEIGLIIGKGGRQIAAENAYEHVFGYCCLLDITVRGKEERVMRKSYETFTPIGPWITTADEVPDPANIDMKLWVNDELRQSANTRDLIVDIPNMIAIASAATTLYPGDIICTGTPAGVGRIVAGDVVTIEVDGIGRMSLPVADSRYGRNAVFAKPYQFVRA